MKDFDSSKSAVSPEDLLDGGDFISDFSVSLGEFPNRLAGTEAETAAARAIRDRLTRETGAAVRLEAFRAQPLAGRASFPFLGLWYLLSLILYYFSFAGGRTAGIWLTLLALFVFVSGGAILISLFLGRRTFRWLLGSRVSYNVVGETKPKCVERGKERVFIIADNHDAVAGSFFKDFAAYKKLAAIVAPLSAAVFVLFCILKMAIGADTAAEISVLSVIPAIAGTLGIFAIVAHFSPFEQHSRRNNGVATSVAMATFAYFAENPALLPEDVRLVYVSLGAENSGHCGSEAFVRAHPEYARATVIALGDVNCGDFQIAECDALRKIRFSTPVVSLIRSSAHEQGIGCETLRHDDLKHRFKSLHGFISNAFAKKSMPTATIIAKKGGNRPIEDIERSDVEKLFSLAVGSIEKLIAETTANVMEDDKCNEVSSELKIKEINIK